MTDHEEIKRLMMRVDELEKEIVKLKSDAKDKELNQLKWGIRSLGAIIILMGGWIWSQVGHMFDFGGR